MQEETAAILIKGESLGTQNTLCSTLNHANIASETHHFSAFRISLSYTKLIITRCIFTKVDHSYYNIIVHSLLALLITMKCKALPDGKLNRPSYMILVNPNKASQIYDFCQFNNASENQQSIYREIHPLFQGLFHMACIRSVTNKFLGSFFSAFSKLSLSF